MTRNIESYRLPQFPRSSKPIAETPVSPLELTPQGYLPLPKIVLDTITNFPDLKPVLLEMAALDPVTFLHQVMVSEYYSLLRQDYIRRISLSNPVKTVSLLNDYLKSFDVPPALTHDIGKWLVDPSPHAASLTINSKPSAEHILLFGENTDHRTEDMIHRHKLHPLLGALAIGELEEYTPNLSKSLLLRMRTTQGSHHEHFGPQMVIGPDGAEIRSYPRNNMRHENDHEKVFHLLIMLADTVVAMGQPRAHRSLPLPDATIIEYVELIIDSFFRSETEQRPEYKKLAARGAFLSASMTALETIREKYRRPVCYRVQGFLDEHGEPLDPIYYLAPTLTHISRQLWRHQRKRF